MPRHLLLVALLVAAAPPPTQPSGGYDFPPERRPGMVVRLHVHVADEPDAAGFARVRLSILVEGPATLEVEPPELGDTTSAWHTQRSSGWRSVEGRADWEETLELRQLKPGVIPIPPVKIRCRENKTATWEEVEWTGILADVRSLPLPVVPPQPPSAWTAWLWVSALPAILILLGVVAFWRRSRRVPPPTLTPAERTLAELEHLERKLAHPDSDPRVFYDSLSSLLRRHVAERFTLPAPRQTTVEFLATVQGTTAVPEEQRERLGAFLLRCDLVKFAGVSPTLDDCREMANFVRTFVREGEKTPVAAETQSSKRKQETRPTRPSRPA